MATPATRTERLVQRLGGAVDGELTVGGGPVGRVAAQVGTPFYAYHGEAIVAQARRVQAALGPETELCYSLKANPSLGICQLLAREGLGAEVASGGELLLAQRAGFPPERTLFAGPGKRDAELEAAVRHGLLAVNAESPGEVERLGGVARRLGATARVALRVNPALAVRGAGMRMGGGPQQFGMDEEQLPEVVAALRQHPHLRLAGLHVYAGTQLFDVEALLAHCHRMVDLALEAATALGRPLEVLDLGGGFGVPYFEGTPEFDLEAFAAGYRGVVRRCQGDPLLARARLVVELGRYLVAEAGVYVARVVDVKMSRGRSFVVTDGGMHHHSAATGNFGQVFRKPYPVALVGRLDAPQDGAWSLVGPCCTPLDTFGHDLPLPAPQVGDLVGVLASGAYGYSASPLAFLSHPTPAEVLVWRGQTHVLRPPGAFQQALEGQRGLDASALEPREAGASGVGAPASRGPARRWMRDPALPERSEGPRRPR